ncbi:MAG: ROK family protein [Oscillospiraceae bacterium]|jgi:glucokinase|nr:ROK family protein [Oscillospiraceae bacterium]
MHLLFDIGGTNFRAAKFDGALTVLWRQNTPTYRDGLTEPQLNERIAAMILETVRAEAANAVPLEGIGVCFAGPVNAGGDILAGPAIYGAPLSKPYALGELLRAEHPNAVVTNDLTAAAMRYTERHRDFLLLTVSSGIGGKLVMDGRVRIGEGGLEGEIGHAPAAFCGEVAIPCSCGMGDNHLNAIASGIGLAHVASRLRDASLAEAFNTSPLRARPDILTPELTRAADAGDPFAAGVIDFCVRPLAHAVSLLLTSCYLEKVIFIGGVAQNCPYYMASLTRQLCGFGVYNYTDAMIREKLALGANDDNHGLLGLVKMLGAAA